MTKGVEDLAAAEHILPDDHTQPVAMVVPAEGFHLDMLTQNVEAQLLAAEDIENQRLVAGCGHQAVGPVALIQQAVMEDRLVIERKDLVTLVLHIGELTHGEIALHRILAAAKAQIVEEGGIRRPGLEVRQGKLLSLIHI